MDKNVFLLMPRKKHYAMGRKNLKFGSSNGDSLKSEVCYVWGSEQNDAGDSWPDFFLSLTSHKALALSHPVTLFFAV